MAVIYSVDPAYTHDDLVRIASINCGASSWQQNFTHDPFGNITKTVPAGGTGNSFQPTYSASTNHITSVAGFTPTYDANGDVTNDGNHTYTWDAFGNASTIDGIGIIYDALDRMVEQNNSGTYKQFIYSPTGFKMQIMNGQSSTDSFVPLPGGGSVVYTASGYYYRHPDWLGSSRFASTSARAMYSDVAYAPFGEPYAQSGLDISFTGMNRDTSTGLYDFLYREYSTQGRWPQPDPAGLGATDPSNPQSWNRYAYVLNSPLANVDPLGLVCNGVNTFMWDPLANGTGIFTPEDCAANGGTWSGSPPQNGSGIAGCQLDGAPVNCEVNASLAQVGAAYPDFGPSWKYKDETAYGSNCYASTVADAAFCLGSILSSGLGRGNLRNGLQTLFNGSSACSELLGGKADQILSQWGGFKNANFAGSGATAADKQNLNSGKYGALSYIPHYGTVWSGGKFSSFFGDAFASLGAQSEMGIAVHELMHAAWPVAKPSAIDQPLPGRFGNVSHVWIQNSCGLDI